MEKDHRPLSVSKLLGCAVRPPHPCRTSTTETIARAVLTDISVSLAFLLGRRPAPHRPILLHSHADRSPRRGRHPPPPTRPAAFRRTSPGASSKDERGRQFILVEAVSEMGKRADESLRFVKQIAQAGLRTVPGKLI